MKTRNSITRNLIMGALCLPLVFASCSKDDDNGAEHSSEVKVVNAAETSGSQDFYLSDRKVNNAAISYNESTSGYISTKSGDDQRAEFRTSGSATAYASMEADLDANKKYTFYLYGQGSSTSIYKTEDDLTAPQDGKAKIRFIHLSTSSEANTDLDIQLGDTEIVSDLAFQSGNNFVEVNPGLHLLQVFGTQGDNPILDLNLTALVEGRIYTVVLSGNSSVNAKVFANN